MRPNGNDALADQIAREIGATEERSARDPRCPFRQGDRSDIRAVFKATDSEIPSEQSNRSQRTRDIEIHFIRRRIILSGAYRAREGACAEEVAERLDGGIILRSTDEEGHRQIDQRPTAAHDGRTDARDARSHPQSPQRSASVEGVISDGSHFVAEGDRLQGSASVEGKGRYRPLRDRDASQCRRQIKSISIVVRWLLLCHIQCHTTRLRIHRHTVASRIRITSENISEHGVDIPRSVRRVAYERKTHLSQSGAAFKGSHSDIFHAARDFHRGQGRAVFERLHCHPRHGQPVIGRGHRDGSGRIFESDHGVSRSLISQFIEQIACKLIHVLVTIGISARPALMQVVSLREEGGLHRAHLVVVCGHIRITIFVAHVRASAPMLRLVIGIDLSVSEGFVSRGQGHVAAMSEEFRPRRDMIVYRPITPLADLSHQPIDEGEALPHGGCFDLTRRGDVVALFALFVFDIDESIRDLLPNGIQEDFVILFVRQIAHGLLVRERDRSAIGVGLSQCPSFEGIALARIAAGAQRDLYVVVDFHRRHRARSAVCRKGYLIRDGFPRRSEMILPLKRIGIELYGDSPLRIMPSEETVTCLLRITELHRGGVFRDRARIIRMIDGAVHIFVINRDRRLTLLDERAHRHVSGRHREHIIQNADCPFALQDLPREEISILIREIDGKYHARSAGQDRHGALFFKLVHPIGDFGALGRKNRDAIASRNLENALNRDVTFRHHKDAVRHGNGISIRVKDGITDEGIAVRRHRFQSDSVAGDCRSRFNGNGAALCHADAHTIARDLRRRTLFPYDRGDSHVCRGHLEGIVFGNGDLLSIRRHDFPTQENQFLILNRHRERHLRAGEQPFLQIL